MICRFTNPEAAARVFDGKRDKEMIEHNVNIDKVMKDILKHTKSKLTEKELLERIMNPAEYDINKIDIIERA